jgi:chaperonin GroES
MAQTKIQPLFSYILIKPVQAETKTASGIVLPDTAQEKQSQMGEVLAIGAGFASEDGRENKIVLKVGDKVVYKKWGGNEIKVDGVEYMLMEQKDIMAIVG